MSNRASMARIEDDSKALHPDDADGFQRVVTHMRSHGELVPYRIFKIVCTRRTYFVALIRDRELEVLETTRRSTWSRLWTGDSWTEGAWESMDAQLPHFLYKPVAQAWASGQLRRAPALVKPPGISCLRVAQALFGSKACAGVFQPVIADMQHEHFDALARGATWEARFAVIRGRIAFVRAVVHHVGVARLLESIDRIRSWFG